MGRAVGIEGKKRGGRVGRREEEEGEGRGGTGSNRGPAPALPAQELRGSLTHCAPGRHQKPREDRASLP